MKKLIALIGTLTMTSNILGNMLNNYQFNNHVIKSNFKNFKSKNTNIKYSKNSKSLITDKDGNVYTLSNNGIIYKCLAEQMEFKEMTGVNSLIIFLTFDGSNNVYALSNNGIIYKCLPDQMEFKAIKGNKSQKNFF